MSQKRVDKLRKVMSICVTIMIFFICCLPTTYFTVFRMLDSSICIPMTASKLGVPWDKDRIYQYVNNELSNSIGLNETEVMERLGKIGRPRILGKTELAVTGEIRERVVISICLHVLNNIWVTNFYTPDGKLARFRLEYDWP